MEGRDDDLNNRDAQTMATMNDKKGEQATWPPFRLHRPQNVRSGSTTEREHFTDC